MYISLPSLQDYDVTTLTQDNDFKIRSLWIQLLKKAPTFDKISFGIRAMKFEPVRIHSLGDVFVAVAVAVAKLPTEGE